MVISPDSPIDLADYFETEYDDVVVYGDAEGTEVLHEGRVTILASGWLELPTGRLLSPQAVHHVDRRT